MSGQARTPETGVMDETVRRYRDKMDSEYRPVFDRLHRPIVATCSDAEVVLSYGMPTYRIGRRHLNIGVWKHELSLYVSPNPGRWLLGASSRVGRGTGDHQAQAWRCRAHPRRRVPGSDTRCAARLT
jgi:hypothetical protein